MTRVSQGPRPEDNYTLISNDLMRDPDLSDRAKAVYLYMRSHRDGWNLNTEKIAKALGRSRNTVMAAVNDLIAAGYVERIQGRINDGMFGTVEYVVHSQRRCSNVEPRSGAGSDFAPVAGSHIEPVAGSDFEPLKKTTSKKTKEKTISSAYTEDFEKFWQTYPKRTGKQAAFRRWKEAVKRADPTVIIEKAGEYARSVQGTEKRFIKNPEGWLNAGRYEDEFVSDPVSSSWLDVVEGSVVDGDVVKELN